MHLNFLTENAIRAKMRVNVMKAYFSLDICFNNMLPIEWTVLTITYQFFCPHKKKSCKLSKLYAVMAEWLRRWT